MKASELISELKSIIDIHGDMEIVGGTISDDTTISRVSVLDDCDQDIEYSTGKAHSIFLEG